MSLSALIQSHDEDALGALASVGLMRRAVRDANAGKARVQQVGPDSATVEADGQNVTVLASGLHQAQCACPSSGICRHILLAVLALRAEMDAECDAADQISAQEELNTLAEESLRKFAGADWDKAITLARISEKAMLSLDGANLRVSLPDVEHNVVFLAGQGLAGAVFKGAKSAKRRVVTAAAFVARQSSGVQAMGSLQKSEPDAEIIAAAFLHQLQRAIEDCVIAVFRGGSVLAEDNMFDLSISARAQAAPRVTALLRNLVRQARQSRSRHFEYNDDRFLTDAALTYALTKALEQSPEDTDLTGQLRRTYRDVDDLELLMLGAARWHTEGGARGLRVYGYDITGQNWVTTVQARAAGMDPGFAPEQSYHQSLWGAATVGKTIAKQLVLRQARAARGAQTAWQLAWDKGQGQLTDRMDLTDLLETPGLVFSQWNQAKADIARRSEIGLRDVGTAVPVVLRAADLSEPFFDDQRQRYVLMAFDGFRVPMELTLPQLEYETVEWIIRVKQDITAILCEARLSALNFVIEPVSVLFAPGSKTAQDLDAFNLTLDRAPRPQKETVLGFGKRALRTVGAKIKPRQSPPSAAAQTAIHNLCSRVLDITVETLRFGDTTRIAGLAAQAQDLSLVTLHDALRDLEKQINAENALRVGYICGGVLAHDAVVG
ncbi:MAG: hypothetical protein AB8B51_06180 [Sedimentitalea sp.]